MSQALTPAGNPSSGPAIPKRASASNVPDTPPASFDEEKAKTHRKERGEKVRFAAELIVGFFVILYTLVSAALWLTGRNANRIAN
jgi:hypothetical protein